MFPWESRRARRSGRDRRRPDFAALERLEARQLLAYSSLGTSLPQITVSGYASPAASWSGPLTVTADVSNIGASTILEPLALAPGSTSSADAAASVIGVFAATNPHFKGAVRVGSISVPPLTQNSFQQITDTITLPARPAGFPADGGTIYLALEGDANNNVFQTVPGHSISAPIPVAIEAPLPELLTVGLDLPPVMQPGDTVQPNIRITNIGPGDTAPQGIVQVALVASTTPNFTSGSSIVYLDSLVANNVAINIPGITSVATQGNLLGDANQTPPINVATISLPPVTLPASPKVYYLGVVIDPGNHLKQLSTVPQTGATVRPLDLARIVGPPIKNLPPAHVLVNGGVALVPTFPTPFNNVPVGGPVGGTFPAAGTTTPIVTQPFPPAVPVAPLLVPTTPVTTPGGGFTTSALPAAVKTHTVKAAHAVKATHAVKAAHVVHPTKTLAR